MISEQHAQAVSLGVGAATQDYALPRSWFESNARFEDEAIVDAAMWKANTSRSDARAMKRKGL